MIAFVEGVLVSLEENEVVLDCHGIGYRVLVPLTASVDIPARGKVVRLYTHYQIRDDQPELFGFVTAGELRLFKKLITVSSIGPKLGLAALSTYPPDRLATAIVSGDVSLLCTISGFGKKTAQRLVLELKDKLSLDLPPGMAEAGAASSRAGTPAADALEALLVLGYARSEAQEALSKAMSTSPPPQSIDDMLKACLKNLSRR